LCKRHPALLVNAKKVGQRTCLSTMTRFNGYGELRIEEVEEVLVV
jgi:hypothetical protein